MKFSMNLPLKCILFLITPVIGLLGKPFHVYSPSSKENTLWIGKILAAADRSACGPVAPPDGLHLTRVDY